MPHATPDELGYLARRGGQLMAVFALIGSLVGAGVFGGRLLSSLDSLTASVTELRAEMRASTQAAANDRYEIRMLRDRVDRLEQTISR